VRSTRAPELPWFPLRFDANPRTAPDWRPKTKPIRKQFARPALAPVEGWIFRDLLARIPLGREEPSPPAPAERRVQPFPVQFWRRSGWIPPEPYPPPKVLFLSEVDHSCSGDDSKT
jgi:hypothetical protein